MNINQFKITISDHSTQSNKINIARESETPSLKVMNEASPQNQNIETLIINNSLTPILKKKVNTRNGLKKSQNPS